MPLVEGKGKSQSDGSNDAIILMKRKHRYDVTTNRRRGHYKTATRLVSDIRNNTGTDLSFFLRSPQKEHLPGPVFLEPLAVVAAKYA